MLNLFGVPRAIHESVVKDALESQRILITARDERIVALEKENLTLRNALDERARDFAKLKEAMDALLLAQGQATTGGSVVSNASPTRLKPPVVVRPSFGQANSHHVIRPTPPKPPTAEDGPVGVENLG